MKNLKLTVLALILIGLVIGAYFLAQSRTTINSEAQIATTIFPLYDITQNIAGEAVEVTNILPAGASPHTFEPTPSTLRKVQNVELVFTIGHGLDNWSSVLTNSLDAEVVTVDHDIDILERVETDEHEDAREDGHRDQDSQDDLDEHENEHTHGHGSTDPHYFLTIPNGVIIAQNIEAELSTQFPEHATVFAANLESYLAELEKADQEVRVILENLPNSHLITMHDGWYYLAAEYGLEIAGTFEPTAGREPTPQYLVELTRALDASDTNTIYSEPQLSTESIEQFVTDNDLQIAILDPLGGVADRQSYIELMLYNANVIAEHQ